MKAEPNAVDPIQQFVHSVDDRHHAGPFQRSAALPPRLPNDNDADCRDVYPDPGDSPAGDDVAASDIAPDDLPEIEFPDLVEEPFDKEEPAEDIIPLDHPETPVELPQSEPDPGDRNQPVLQR